MLRKAKYPVHIMVTFLLVYVLIIPAKYDHPMCSL